MQSSTIIQRLETKEPDKRKRRTTPCNSLSSMATKVGGKILSYVIGDPFPSIPYLPSKDITGQLYDSCASDGTGLSKLIDEAAALAKTHPSGMCYFRLAHAYCLFVSGPDQLKQIFRHHEYKMTQHDTLGLFLRAFGQSGAIFSERTYTKQSVKADKPVENPVWRMHRDEFESRLFKSKALQSLVEPMKRVIFHYMAEVKNLEGNIADVEDFCARFTMGIIGENLLGFKKFSEKDKRQLTTLFSFASREAGNPKTALLFRLPNFISKYFTRELDDVQKKGRDILKRIIKENAKDILASKNWLADIAKKHPKGLDADELLNLAMMIIFVGHETSAKLLQFMLMLLCDPDHKEIFNKLRAEIANHVKKYGPPENWNFDQLNELSYMDAVEKASLDLFPPLPNLKSEVEKPFSITFKGAKGTEEIRLPKGVLVFCSPWVTQRLNNDFDFNPDAFHDNPTRESNLGWFPFGFGKRRCAGQKFALQEIKLFVAILAHHHRDLTISPKDQKDQNQEGLGDNYYQVTKGFNLRPVAKLSLKAR